MLSGGGRVSAAPRFLLSTGFDDVLNRGHCGECRSLLAWLVESVFKLNDAPR